MVEGGLRIDTSRSVTHLDVMATHPLQAGRTSVARASLLNPRCQSTTFSLRNKRSILGSVEVQTCVPSAYIHTARGVVSFQGVMLHAK